jgi:hypothetical protein
MKKVTMQHDLFVNPSRRGRSAYPLLAVLQANIVGGDSLVVAPLLPVSAIRPPRSRLVPLVEHDRREYALMIGFLNFIPARYFRDPVGSIAQYRDDISRALDWLFFGI